MMVAVGAKREAPAKSDMAGAGLRTFFNIARRWKLSEQQQMRLLGLESRSTFQSWKAKAAAHAPLALGRDSLERISYVLGIYKAINILLPVPERADGWIGAANSAGIFGGRAPIERMTGGNVGDLFVVRQHLDALRG